MCHTDVFYSTCHITLTWHVYKLTIRLGGGGDGGGVPAEREGGQAGDHCFSGKAVPFVNVTPSDIFRIPQDHFQHYCGYKKLIFLTRCLVICSCVCVNNRSFSLFCLNIKSKIEPEETWIRNINSCYVSPYLWIYKQRKTFLQGAGFVQANRQNMLSVYVSAKLWPLSQQYWANKGLLGWCPSETWAMWPVWPCVSMFSLTLWYQRYNERRTVWICMRKALYPPCDFNKTKFSLRASLNCQGQHMWEHTV